MKLIGALALAVCLAGPAFAQSWDGGYWRQQQDLEALRQAREAAHQEAIQAQERDMLFQQMLEEQREQALRQYCGNGNC